MSEKNADRVLFIKTFRLMPIKLKCYSKISPQISIRLPNGQTIV
jgi:hypothetical protein